ncbi:MAG: hypothetical protein ACRD1K_15750 [Acidimicrobiales bacterium]
MGHEGMRASLVSREVIADPVEDSSGTPPASPTPALARLASRSSGNDATPTCVRPQSSSPKPTARSMARAGARTNPQ